jgi:hypothetical protein
MKERVDATFDFGFTLEDETDILQRSQITNDLNSELDALYYKVDLLKTKLNSMNLCVHDMGAKITPLLNNLLKDADTKPIINWPNRKEKIQQFMALLNQIITEADSILEEK